MGIVRLLLYHTIVPSEVSMTPSSPMLVVVGGSLCRGRGKGREHAALSAGALQRPVVLLVLVLLYGRQIYS